MPINKRCILVILIVFQALTIYSQGTPEIEQTTPFRKGRWFTGLSGSISSNINQLQGNESRTQTNEFGLSMTTGKFLKDRLLFGGILNINRSSSDNIAKSSTESLFIGPSLRYYLQKAKEGSIFGEFSPGYVRFRETIELTNINTIAINQESIGSGFGSLIGIGYSYVLHDRITFDLGLRLNLFWLTLENESKLDNTITKVDVLSSNLSFSFGFNVLLDDFFF